MQRRQVFLAILRDCNVTNYLALIPSSFSPCSLSYLPPPPPLSLLKSYPSISPSLFPVRFPLASATHSPDIERTSRGREGATPDGRVFPLELADWLAAAVAFTDLPQPAAGSGDPVCPFRDAALLSSFTSVHSQDRTFRERIREIKDWKQRTRNRNK